MNVNGLSIHSHNLNPEVKRAGAKMLGTILGTYYGDVYSNNFILPQAVVFEPNSLKVGDSLEFQSNGVGWAADSSGALSFTFQSSSGNLYYFDTPNEFQTSYYDVKGEVVIVSSSTCRLRLNNGTINENIPLDTTVQQTFQFKVTAYDKQGLEIYWATLKHTPIS